MDIFSGIDVVNQAIDMTLVRKDLIGQNISNADTPGYKRQDIDFESTFAKEIKKVQHLEKVNLERLEVKPYRDNRGTSYRMDGNNVDIQIERSEEAKVEMRYNALVTRMTAQLNRLKSTLQSLK